MQDEKCIHKATLPVRSLLKARAHQTTQQATNLQNSVTIANLTQLNLPHHISSRQKNGESGILSERDSICE